MIIVNDNDNIFLSWREKEKRISKRVAFDPYFFVEADAPEPSSYKINKYLTGAFAYEECDWRNLQGKELKKVFYEKASDSYKARECFSKTYEGDVPFHHRYTVDNITEIPEYKMRKWYWDMEWQQGGEHDGAITAIVVYDNYDKEYSLWTWFPNNTEMSDTQSVNARRWELQTADWVHIYSNEMDMLRTFTHYVQHKDPDMLIAWFGLQFDFPKLLERCCLYGLNPNVMSPIGRIDKISRQKGGGYKSSVGEGGFPPISQPLKGRLMLNLDFAFERQWNDAQKGTLPSLALDYVSETILGEKKLISEKFPDKNEFFRRGWLEDTETYLDYALKDVELIKRIDEENHTSEAILSLQRLLIAPFDACFYASNMASIFFMRNAWWKAPTGIKRKFRVCKSCNDTNDLKRKSCKSCKESLTYSGAMVYDPLSENTNGLHEGIAAFDFAQLYPSMMIARNISWETKSDEPTELGVNIKTPKDFSECVDEEMAYYNTDSLGLLPQSVIELRKLRTHYKGLLREARENDNESDIIKWNNNQMGIKRIMASFYGVLAFDGFGWADRRLAESITASAREAIRSAAFKVRGME